MKNFCKHALFATLKTNYKIFLAMKFTILLALITSLNVSASLYSQDAKLNLSVKDKTVKEVIKLIENQSNFRFFFSDDYLDLNRKVSFTAQNKNINEVLSDLLVEGAVTYKVLDNNVVVITPAMAQQVKITGVVNDSNTGEALPGVNVVIKGTTRGVTTDMDGKFSIEAGAADVLVFSYVGYLSQEVATAGQSNLKVALVPDVKKLDEVVVIGYGVVKKRDLTGSVSSIKSEDIARTSSSNALQSVQAKMPGIDIQQKDGQAGSGLSITLRGNRSIYASNAPLILVDGVEYGSTLDLNPSDIESYDILKDASSTAIYGTKGANGVIIITTKRGKAGKTIVNFNAFVSSNRPTNVPEVMYGDKEVQLLIDKANYKADLASGNWGTSNAAAADVLTLSLFDGTKQLDIYNDKSYTDWANIILKNGLTHNYELSVSGGNEKTNYNLSLGMMNEEGLLRKDELKRYNGKINIDHKINNIFKVGSSILYTYKNRDARNASVFSQAMKMTTITHAYLTNGTINSTPNPFYAAHCNPLLDEVDGAYQNNILSSRIFGNTYLEVTPLKNLVFKSMFALDRTNNRNGVYADYQSVGRYQAPGTSLISNESELTTKYTWDNTLNYNQKFGIHDISVLAGQSMTASVYEESIISGSAGQEHYYTSAFYDVYKIVGTPTIKSAYTKSSMLSYFGRLNYTLNDKYLLTASVRADGSSMLAKGHKWGYFPSVAGAWRVNEESFMADTKSWLSNLKLRVSWGISGNAAIDPYKTLPTLNSTPINYYAGATNFAGYYPSNVENLNLKWETTKAYNFGLDFGIFDNRVTGSVDYFISKTSDLLSYRYFPGSSVFTSVLDNIGKTEAKGIEISLNTMIVKSKDFSWDVNWSYYHADDKVTFLSEGITKNISGQSGYIVGQPVSMYYDYEANGNWGVGEYATYSADWLTRHPGGTLSYASNYGTPGTIKLIDMDDNGKIDDSDKRVYNRSPKHVIGMSNTFTYQNLSLDVLVYARLGGYLQYGLNSLVTYDGSNWGNLDYWTYTNQGAKFPTPGVNTVNSTLYSAYATSLLYEKADYIKIKDITLSYSLPKSLIGKVGLSQLKVYGSLKNFFTFASIDNYDPERDGSISFPLAKQVVFGVNVQF
jgi:TonB-dependent starch-binding outer membrane protein SusC